MLCCSKGPIVDEFDAIQYNIALFLLSTDLKGQPPCAARAHRVIRSGKGYSHIQATLSFVHNAWPEADVTTVEFLALASMLPLSLSLSLCETQQQRPSICSKNSHIESTMMHFTADSVLCQNNHMLGSVQSCALQISGIYERRHLFSGKQFESS